MKNNDSKYYKKVLKRLAFLLKKEYGFEKEDALFYAKCYLEKIGVLKKEFLDWGIIGKWAYEASAEKLEINNLIDKINQFDDE